MSWEDRARGRARTDQEWARQLAWAREVGPDELLRLYEAARQAEAGPDGRLAALAALALMELAMLL